MIPNSYELVGLLPGQLPSIETVEQELTSVIWNRLDQQWIGSNRQFAKECVDVGNTGNTDVLRPGLLLTVDGNGHYREWGGVADFATDKIEGVVLLATKMNLHGTQVNRYMGYVFLGGGLKERGVIVPGEVNPGIVGHAQETNIRTQMKYNTLFDDDPFGHLAT